MQNVILSITYRCIFVAQKEEENLLRRKRFIKRKGILVLNFTSKSKSNPFELLIDIIHQNRTGEYLVMSDAAF